MKIENDDRILDHYRQEATQHRLRPTSTMADEITREREVRAVVDWLRRLGAGSGRLLEIGCGNAYLLSLIRDSFQDLELSGIDLSPDMVAIALERRLARCSIATGDVRSLPFPDEHFDFVVSERCLINVLDPDDQMTALHEVARVVRSGGHAILIEAFTDAAENLNAARDELGLPAIPMTHHNRWFDKGAFLGALDGSFDVINADTMNGEGEIQGLGPNFLSSHFFVSRVLYPAVTKRDVRYNTEFVRFFAPLPPRGNYSPIQLYVVSRRQDDRA